MLDRKNWVVLGCGYTGRRLARRLVRDGRSVVVTRRAHADAEALAAEIGGGVEPAAVDIADRDAVRACIRPGAVVVDSVPPTPGDVSGEHNVVAAARAAGAARLVYLSSTGVYPATPGDDPPWIDETTEPDPPGARGAARLAAESAVLDAAAHAGLEAVALRLSGIYGPGRGVPARVRAGTYRTLGPGDSYVCRIHVDDIVAAVLAAGAAEQLPSRIYNVTDDDPAPSRAVADAVAGWLGVPSPPAAPLDELSPDAVAMLTANRRVSNRRIARELGVTLRYPTWREGFRAALFEHE